MERKEPTSTSAREPALAWLCSSATVEPSSFPTFLPGPQASLAMEAWLAGGSALAELEELSFGGESIAARSLAAVHAAIVALAGATTQPPRPDLRTRLLQSAATARTVVPTGGESVAPPDAPMLLSPVVAVGRKHAGRADEPRRTATVKHFGADGADDEGQLERLLEQVANWVDFPLLVVSIVHGGATAHRAFRSTLTAPPPVVPREASFCTHCVAGDAPLVIEDARADAFFMHHPAVAAFNLVAYCGVPLRVGIGTPEEAVIGTLCGYDIRPRPVLVEDAATLEIFARRVASIIERRVEDASWSDLASLGEDREVLAPGPFLDLALVALRREPRGGRSALLVGAAMPRVPHGADLDEPGLSLAAGRLPNGRAAWLLQERIGAEYATTIGEGSARLADKLGALGAPVGVSVLSAGLAASDGTDDLAAWLVRATSRPAG